MYEAMYEATMRLAGFVGWTVHCALRRRQQAQQQQLPVRHVCVTSLSDPQSMIPLSFTPLIISGYISSLLWGGCGEQKKGQDPSGGILSPTPPPPGPGALRGPEGGRGIEGTGSRGDGDGRRGVD